uniref:Uncharacterized protein n=1 Tax=Oryza barthii TaxID=65489 RepID=A0A0D3HQM9_9ORYZ
MPSNHLDGLSRGEVEEWLKRVNKRERRRKRRSKWSSVPPSCRTLHNRCRGISTTAQESSCFRLKVHS